MMVVGTLKAYVTWLETREGSRPPPRLVLDIPT